MSRSNEVDLGLYFIPDWALSLDTSSVLSFSPMVRRRLWILSYGSVLLVSSAGFGLGSLFVCGKVLLLGGS